MARIPESEIERLKREVSVQRLAEARGVNLKRHGADLIGLCPFHEDHSPSLVISPQKNLWNCLGACGKGGSVIDWVMCAEGVSFRHAVELLREDHLPVAARPGAKPPRISSVPKLPAPVSRDADDRALLLQIVSYYNETLKQSPEALKYLEGRGLKSSEMIDRFQMGFANRTLGYRLPEKNRLAGAELRGRLQKLGIYRESGHEHFNGSLVIPIFDPQGQVVQMYGRKIAPSNKLRDGVPEHLYLPGPQQGVWNETALAVSKEIILCEALIDALTFWCAGFRHVTTSYGINGFTDEHRAALKKYGTKKIYIAYDRDDAGERAAQEVAEELLATGIECYRVQFPKNMDANEYALKVQPAAKSLGIVLNKAAWLGKGQRPTVAVIEPQIIEPEPQPAVEEEKSEAAAKEKISEPIEATVREESALPLAAESVEPIQEAALPSALSPTIEVPTEIKPEEIVITQGDRRYRVRGLGKNMSYEVLRVNVLVSGTNLRGESGFHVDTLDLYSARQRTVFMKQAAEELGVKEEVIRRDLGHVLLKLEELQDQQIKNALEPKPEEAALDDDEREAAMALLHDPHMLDRILADFERCGMVGEETNKLVSYLAVTSRLLESPLAILVQSSSAAGKTALMEAVLALLPEEQQVQYSAMTGQSLFYMGESDLKHKVLAVVEEEGALRAAYALKLLQSEGVLTIASTGKDATTGRLITHQYRVEGPVMLFLTTTAIDLDEELQNRCLVLAVDEDRAQTQAIHKKQREAQTIDRDAADGTHPPETVRSGLGTRHHPHPHGQGQEGPFRAYRRSRGGLGAKIYPGSASETRAGPGQRHAVPVERGRRNQPRSSHADGTLLRSQGEDRQDRSLPSLPPHHGHVDARRRGRHPFHPANARPRGTVHDGNLHARLDPHAEAGAQRHASGSVAQQGRCATTARPLSASERCRGTVRYSRRRSRGGKRVAANRC
jgi:DNA primase catalytic core